MKWYGSDEIDENFVLRHSRHLLSTLATDSPGELDILRHYGNPFRVNGAQIGVFEETYQVRLRGLLKGTDGS